MPSPQAAQSSHALDPLVQACLEPLRVGHPLLSAELAALEQQDLNPDLAAAILLFGFLSDQAVPFPSRLQSPAPVATQLAKFYFHGGSSADVQRETSSQLFLLKNHDLVRGEHGCYALQNLPGLIQDSRSAAILDKVIEPLLEARRIHEAATGPAAASPPSILQTFLSSSVMDVPEGDDSAQNERIKRLGPRARQYSEADKIPAWSAEDLSFGSAARATSSQARLAAALLGERIIDHILDRALLTFPIGCGDVLRLAPYTTLESPEATLTAGPDGRSFLLTARGQTNERLATYIPRIAYSQDKVALVFSIGNALTFDDYQRLCGICRSVFGQDWTAAQVIFREMKAKSLKRFLDKCDTGPVTATYTYNVLLPRAENATEIQGMTLFRQHPHLFVPAEPRDPASSTASTEHMITDWEKNVLDSFLGETVSSVAVERVTQYIRRSLQHLRHEGESNEGNHFEVLRVPGKALPFERLLAREAMAAAEDPARYAAGLLSSAGQFFDFIALMPQRGELLGSLSRSISRWAQLHYPEGGKAPLIPRHALSFPNFFFSSLCSSWRECAAGNGGRLSSLDMVKRFNELLISPKFEGQLIVDRWPGLRERVLEDPFRDEAVQIGHLGYADQPPGRS